MVLLGLERERGRPVPTDKLRGWYEQGLFPVGEELPVRMQHWQKHVPLWQVYDKEREFFLGPPRTFAEPVPQQGRPPGRRANDGSVQQWKPTSARTAPATGPAASTQQLPHCEQLRQQMVQHLQQLLLQMTPQLQQEPQGTQVRQQLEQHLQLLLAQAPLQLQHEPR